MKLWVGVWLLIGCCQATDIVQLEYYFDTDPGFGSGTQISISAGPDIDVTPTLSLAGLSPGIHKLTIRAKDSNGKWSIACVRTIYANPAPSPQITAIEYFIDNDPGIGSGTAFTFSSSTDVDIDETIDLSSYNPGTHTLSIRAQDDQGRWGTPYVRSFGKQVTIENITELEYFFETDPGFGNGTNIPVAPATTQDQTTNVDLNSLSMGSHDLYLRAKHQNGRWGIPFISKKLIVPDMPPNISVLNHRITSNGSVIVPDATISSFTPEAEIDLDQNFSLAGLTNYLPYDLQLWGQDVNGRFSVPYSWHFTVCPPGKPCNGESEPNDDASESEPLDLVTDLGVSGFASNDLFGVLGQGDEDWFSFGAQQGDRLTVSVISQTPGFVPRVAVHSPNGNQMVADVHDAPGDNARIANLGFSESGQHFFRVTSSSGQGSYRLTVLKYSNGLLETDLNGSNNTLALAENLNLTSLAKIGGSIDFNEAMDGPDEDWYKGTLLAGQILHLRTYHGQFNELDPGIQLYDSVGSLLTEDLNSACNGFDAELMYTVPLDGTYYTRIFSESGNNWDGNYQLEWRIETPATTMVSMEPNHLPEDATVIPLDILNETRATSSITLDGHLNVSNPDDWYLLPLDHPGTLTFTSNKAPLIITVLNSQQVPLTSGVLGDGENQLPAVSTGEPTYLHLQVLGSSARYSVQLNWSPNHVLQSKFRMFYESNHAGTWQEIQNQAELIRGNLVTLDSEEIDRFLQRSTIHGQSYWIGFFLSGDRWSWVSGLGGSWPSSGGAMHVNWAAGQPGVGAFASEEPNGKWLSRDRTDQLKGLIEVRPAVITSPRRSMTLLAGDGLLLEAGLHPELEDSDYDIAWTVSDGRTFEGLEPGWIEFNQPGTYVIQLRTNDLQGNPVGQPSQCQVRVLTPQPEHVDLHLFSVQWPQKLVPHVPVEITFSTTNVGEGALSGSDCPESGLAHPVYYSYAVSQDSVLSMEDAIVKHGANLLHLKPNESHTESQIIYPEEIGDEFLIMSLDPDYQIRERSHRNNTISSIITWQERGCYDFDTDGAIGVLDLVILANAKSCQLGSSCYSELMDLNGDEEIDALDLAGLFYSWSGRCE